MMLLKNTAAAATYASIAYNFYTCRWYSVEPRAASRAASREPRREPQAFVYF